MLLRCRPQWERFRRLVPSDLLSRFLTDSPVQLSRAPLPRQLLLESECTPGGPRFNLFRSQARQQKISHHCDGHRALHPGRILGHLVLA